MLLIPEPRGNRPHVRTRIVLIADLVVDRKLATIDIIYLFANAGTSQWKPKRDQRGIIQKLINGARTHEKQFAIFLG